MIFTKIYAVVYDIVMKARVKKKIRIGAKAALKILDQTLETMFLSRREMTMGKVLTRQYESLPAEFWESYYPSSMKEALERLKRKGQVEVRQKGEEYEVRITERGKREVIKGKISELGIAKPEKWDGKWRMVFFDVEELNRTKRDMFRRWIVKLGLMPMQRSVYVYPYPLEREVSFLREVVGVPHGVKLVTAEKVENDGELREWFDL